MNKFELDIGFSDDSNIVNKHINSTNDINDIINFFDNCEYQKINFISYINNVTVDDEYIKTIADAFGRIDKHIDDLLSKNSVEYIKAFSIRAYHKDSDEVDNFNELFNFNELIELIQLDKIDYYIIGDYLKKCDSDWFADNKDAIFTIYNHHMNHLNMGYEDGCIDSPGLDKIQDFLEIYGLNIFKKVIEE